MNDENQTVSGEQENTVPVVDDQPADAAPVDIHPLPAHEVDEDAEENIGDEIKDPWSDPDQTDWPINDPKVPAESGEVDA